MSFGFWLELLARSTALLLIGEVLLLAIRTASPALRHRIVLWMFALLAFLPLLTAITPAIPIALWPKGRPQTARVTVFQSSSKSIPSNEHGQFDVLWLAWAAGVMMAAAPIAVGGLSIRRIARRGTRIGADIYLCEELRVPVTCGVLRPQILLPASAEHWTPARLNAVIAHERAHIRRRDVATQTAAHLIAALWWFQPLAWRLLRKLRAESEFSCDAEAIAAGVRPSEYAAELLGIAADLGAGKSAPAMAIAMLRSAKLEPRLRAILSQPRTRFSRAAVLALIPILTAAEFSAAALTLHSDPDLHISGGSMLKRTTLSALLASAGLSAATITGTVHNAQGGPVAGAAVVLTNPDTSATQQTSTTSDGKFTLTGNAAGEYILQIQKPGLNSILREFDVRAESTFDRDYTMPSEGGDSVPDVTPASTRPERPPLPVKGDLAENNLVRKVQPVYPKSAKLNHEQGTVELQAVISKDGVPAEIRVVSSPGDDLSQSALEAVRQWRYRPTLLNGNPVEITTKIVVNYTLSQ